jgi:hypothetical protein
MKHKDNLWPRAHDTVWLDIKPEWKRSRCCCILTQVARNGKKNANTFCCLSERVDLSLGKPTGGRVEEIVYVHADKKTTKFLNSRICKCDSTTQLHSIKIIHVIITYSRVNGLFYLKIAENEALAIFDQNQHICNLICRKSSSKIWAYFCNFPKKTPQSRNVPKRLQFAQSVRSPCRPVKVG